MNLVRLVSLLSALVLVHAAEDVLTPSGIPATSGLPFSTLSFDTTSLPSSALSALSSLISSESTALTPFTSPSASASASASTTGTATSPTSSVSTLTTIISASPTSTSSSGARSNLWGDRSVGLVVAGVVVGAVVALV